MINIYILPIRTIITITFFLLLLWTSLSRLSGKIGKHLYCFWEITNIALLCIAIIGILYYTIINRSSGVADTMHFVRTIEDIKQQPELIREMIMNAFLFFPFGLTMPYVLYPNRIIEKNRKKYRPVFITILSAFLFSASIELIQYQHNFGNAELSDILMNTLGAAIGTVSYGISQKLLN